MHTQVLENVSSKVALLQPLKVSICTRGHLCAGTDH